MDTPSLLSEDRGAGIESLSYFMPIPKYLSSVLLMFITG